MSTALNGRVNGHAKLNGDHRGTNGYAEDAEWAGQFLPPPLRLGDDGARALKVEACLAELNLCGATLRRVANVFERELTRGLRQQPSSLQMENTYVPELPDGTEEGVFLALDLGGTNFRVLLVELRGGQMLREDVKQYHISDELRLGPGEDLFNFLADCVQDFVRSEGMEDQEMSLGFTFSFPMKQHSISSGELITWTKSFKCGGMGGVDVAALLQRCLHDRRLKVTVRVLLNDTTGTLVAGAHQDRRVGIGVILGTGSNGCYMESASAVTHWEAARRGRGSAVCVDIEWGAFGDNGCLDFMRTDLDREVDARSLLVGSFTFEKYIGGKYLGDLVRAALARLAGAGLLPAAPPPGTISSEHVSFFEEDNENGSTTRTLAALRSACPETAAAWSDADALVAQHAARMCSNRAAQLVSVCVAVLVQRMARPHVVVAVDGSVFKRHPRIRGLMEKYIALLQPYEFSLMGAEDGSGKGSALTAAIAARIAAQDN
ncbi:hexokinase-1-like isoform X1 [Cydia splendana]|uniref:hexokinase-1-like isoform X1 n=1 Tax=Cydia splendana TaxID=1100963 RepID=UPI00300C9515